MLRKDILHLTQVQFAQELGISGSAINQIESGKTYPSLETIIKIHEKYKIAYNFLLTGEGFPGDSLDVSLQRSSETASKDQTELMVKYVSVLEENIALRKRLEV
jgi:transcriptional regulator with XRE-family HTH domain